MIGNTFLSKKVGGHFEGIKSGYNTFHNLQLFSCQHERNKVVFFQHLVNRVDYLQEPLLHCVKRAPLCFTITNDTEPFSVDPLYLDLKVIVFDRTTTNFLTVNLNFLTVGSTESVKEMGTPAVSCFRKCSYIFFVTF